MPIAVVSSAKDSWLLNRKLGRLSGAGVGDGVGDLYPELVAAGGKGF